MQSNSRTTPIALDQPGAPSSGAFNPGAVQVAILYRKLVGAYGNYGEAVEAVERVMASGVPAEALIAVVENYNRKTRGMSYRPGCKKFFETGEWQAYTEIEPEERPAGNDQVDEITRRLAARSKG